MEAMTFTLTRQQLYDLVWSEPMRTLAAKIGISDVAIAKHCRKCEVPVPERGYWNKLQAGHKVVQTPLEPSDLGTVGRASMSGSFGPELRDRIKGAPGEPDTAAETLEALTERFRKRLGRVPIRRGFTVTHPAIATLLHKDEKYRQERAASPYSWHQPQFESAFERRRLEILNTIFLAVVRVGGEAWTRGSEARELGLRIGDQSISFELDHPGAKPGRNIAPPPGKKPKLILRLAYTRLPADVVAHWEDKDGLPLEDQLADIIVGLALAAETFHRHWIAEQAAWRHAEQERQEKLAREKREADERRERERLAAAEKAKVDALLLDAENWRKAAEIRAYVAAVAATKNNVSASYLEWQRWALSEADKLDPIASSKNSGGILSSV